MTTPHRVATLDLGSNTLILLVVERGPSGWVRVEEQAVIARISRGLDASGELHPESVTRARDVLAGFADRMAALGVEAAVATGTAPFRRAANGAEVAASLSQTLGVPIDVVSGAHEADLALLATQASFPDAQHMLVVDIGGASTELIHVRPGHAVQKVSLDVGAVRLTERCIDQHPITWENRQAVLRSVQSALDVVPWVRPAVLAGAQVVGVAGTVTTLAAAWLQMETWDADRVHGLQMPTGVIDHLADQLAALPIEARATLPGVPAGRADVLPAGGWLLSSILRAAAADQVVVSDRGVRWGRLFEAFGA